jgi:hypothetical protein
MISLSPLYLVAKPSLERDFEFSGSPPAAREVQSYAFAWLQCHIHSCNAVTVGLWKVGSEWWLARAVNDTGTDPSGRPLYHMALGKVRGTVGPDQACQALLGAYQGGVPERGQAGECLVPLASLSPEDPRDSLRAAVSLALGFRRVAVVREPGTAAALLARISVDRFDFIGLFPQGHPYEYPPGRGVILSMLSVPQAQEVEELLDLPFSPTLDFGGLADLESSSAQRTALLRSACGLEGPPADLSPSESRWLLKNSLSRESALQTLPEARIGDLLRGGDLSAADLRSLKGRLSPEHGPWVARVLQGTAGALPAFAELLGPGAEGADLLLEPAPARLWRWLQEGANGDLPEAIDSSAIQALEAAGLMRKPLLPALARAVRLPRGQPLRRPFRDALVREGLDPSVAEGLFSGRLPDRAPAEDPRLPPDPGWLAGVDCALLRHMGRCLKRSASWRRWWAAAMSVHPEAGPDRRVDQPGGSWDVAKAWFLSGAVRDGELPLGETLDRIAAWRRQPGGPSPREILHLLEEMDVSAGPSVRGILGGRRAPEGGESENSPSSLGLLLEHGVVVFSEVVDAVRAGQPTSLLGEAGVQEDVVALLDPERVPPDGLRGAWPEPLTGLLAERVATDAFWCRWPRGVPVEVAQRLCSLLEGKAAAALPKAVLDAIAMARRLTILELRAVGRGLPSHAVCHQLTLWAAGWLPGASEALQILPAAPSLPPELRAWLVGELFRFQTSTPPPALTAREMTALLPLLHPLREVLRPVLLRDTADPGEKELLAALAPRLARCGCAAPPPIQETLARRRPDWIRVLKQLPGWENWHCSAAEENPPPEGDAVPTRGESHEDPGSPPGDPAAA